MSSVYQITFSTDPDQWKYIGKADDVAKRKRDHKAASRKPWSEQKEGSIAWAIKWLDKKNMVVVELESGLTSDEAFARRMSGLRILILGWVWAGIRTLVVMGTPSGPRSRRPQ